MEFLLTLVNHFPLFALMLSVKDTWRLPGRRHVSFGFWQEIGRLNDADQVAFIFSQRESR
jgi:hypothetical protein